MGGTVTTEPTQQHGTCLICARRDPHHGLVCNPCQQRVRDLLDELLDLWPLLADETLTRSGGINLAPIDLMLPIPSVLSRRLADSVRDTMLPKWQDDTVEIRDPDSGALLGAYRQRFAVTGHDGTQATYAAGDQHGNIPLIHWADTWVRYWRDMRAGFGHRETLPVPTIDRLTSWLRARIDWASDTADTAVDDMAAELAEQVAMMRRVTHMAPQRIGRPCPSCEMMALTRWPYSKYDECRYCRHLVKRSEYDADTEYAMGGAA